MRENPPGKSEWRIPTGGTGRHSRENTRPVGRMVRKRLCRARRTTICPPRRRRGPCRPRPRGTAMAVELTLPLADDPAAAARAAELRELDNGAFLWAAVREPHAVHHRTTDRLLGHPDAPDDDSAASLLLRALHLCFDAHLPLSLSPDLLWYAVVHEVATHVRLNADSYAGVFTDTPGEKRTITVRDDALLGGADWQRSLHLVRGPLRARIGDEVADLFQPAFSTTTPVEASAVLIALMDVVSPYYDFRWVTLCGIPRVRLEGTAQDWRLLVSRVR